METQVRTREELGKLLASLGQPGRNRAQKIETVKKLNIKNSQGHGLELTLDTFPEF